MEDDCRPFYYNNFDCISEFLIIKKNYLDTNNNWDIFLGGSIKTTGISNMIKLNEFNFSKIYSSENSNSMFMIVYNNTSYDIFLNYDMTLPIDSFWYYKLNCVISVPFLFTVNNHISTIRDNDNSTVGKRDSDIILNNMHRVMRKLYIPKIIPI